MTELVETAGQAFESVAKEWLTNTGSLMLRWLGQEGMDGHLELIDGALLFSPLELPDGASDFQVQAGPLKGGLLTLKKINASRAGTIIRDALQGIVAIGQFRATLKEAEPRNHYLESARRDEWFNEIQIRISGRQIEAVPILELLRQDASLRSASPPFDGIRELCQWLALSDRRGSHSPAGLTITVRTPVDLIFDRSSFKDGVFSATLLAHAQLPKEEIALAVRGFPGKNLETRIQAATRINWRAGPSKRLVEGTLKVEVPHSDSVLAMLTLRQHTIRRQWFLDPDRTINGRLFAFQNFDKDLKQLKTALLDSTDSARFELAVAALLFMTGFYVAPQLEKDAPDLIASTPSGTLILVECTTRVADFGQKVGKIVDRQRLLKQKLESSGQASNVAAILVTSQSRQNMAVNRKQLAELGIILICKEELAEGIQRVRIPTNADEMLDKALAELTSIKNEIAT